MASGHGLEHGHTPAAWTGAAIVFLGCLVGSAGVVMAMIPIFWVGLAVMLVGCIVGKAMSMAGMGHPAAARNAAGAANAAE